MDGESYFRDLPPPIFEVETDPTGEFTFDLPAGGRFVLAARADQPSGTGSHPRYWLVQITVPDGTQQLVPLSGKNVSSAQSADSLLQTAD